MRRKALIYLFFTASIIVFVQGIRMYAIAGLVESTITCDAAFNSRCSLSGQCSYNIAKTASDCSIVCETKYTLNDVEKTTRGTVKCGIWKSGNGTGRKFAGNKTSEFDPEGDGTPWEDPFTCFQ